ncbi:Hypothetical protein PHPALM_2011, partial [Phytophthora palmivora]
MASRSPVQASQQRVRLSPNPERRRSPVATEVYRPVTSNIYRLVVQPIVKGTVGERDTSGNELDPFVAGGASFQEILEKLWEQFSPHVKGRAVKVDGAWESLQLLSVGLIVDYQDLWRIRLGADEPARVELFRLVLKKDSQPVRAYMRNYTKELIACGYVYPNNASRWVSAVVPVPKPGSDDYRITCDYRLLNRMTVPIAASVPNLAVVSSRVKGAKAIGKFDMFKGFWQLPPHEDSREAFSFQTDEGVFTPTRVPQGHNAGSFGDLINEQLLVYVDDVILFASSHEEYLQVLEKFFKRLRELRLKLNLKKSAIYQEAVNWCGKIIDGNGVTHDPTRLESLVKLPLPQNAAELQHFLCAVNWIRDSVVDYGRAVAPLQKTFDLQAQTPCCYLSAEIAEYKTFLNKLASSATLVFPHDEATICLSTDADQGWAIVVTQVHDWKNGVPVNEQNHQLLVCKGGSFKGSQLQWSVVEKEAFPIVLAASELDYSLQRRLGYRIYTDHANLIHIFCPDHEVKKHADIVSRWPVREDIAVVTKVKAVRTRSQPSASLLRPLQDDSFEWPSNQAIQEGQGRFRGSLDADFVEVDNLIFVNDKLWIPRQAKDLLTRVLLVAHCGIQAHRGQQVMITQLEQHFAIDRLYEIVTKFLSKCLLCKHIKGGKLIQRPWSDTNTSMERNE